MTVRVTVKLDPRLYREACKRADLAGIPIAHAIHQALADQYGLKDCREVPHQRMGRPPKRETAIA